MSHEYHTHQPNSDALAPIEQTLAGFTPVGPRLDRDRLMFLAGQASARCQEPGDRGQGPGLADIRVFAPSRHWLWPATAATFAATSLALLVALVMRPAIQPQIVYRDGTEAVPVGGNAAQPRAGAAREELLAVRPAVWQPPAIPPDNYVHTRDVALRLGLDALGTTPISAAAPAPTLNYLQLLDSLVPTDDKQSPAAAPSPPTM